MKDEHIIAQIRKGRREKAIRHLYKEFPKIKSLICSSGGDSQAAEEIFHDSLILLIEKVSNPNFELSSKLSTYLYGINRLLWKNQLRKQNKTQELEWSDTLIISEEDLEYNYEKEEKLKKLESILATITEKCTAIFELFYFQKMKMKEIAEKLGYSSVNSAKTQKYKCVEQAVKLANQVKHS